MSLCKGLGLAILAAVCLLGETTGSAHAQCNSFLTLCATEWSGGSIINLGGLPGSPDSAAFSINDRGHVVGWSSIGDVPDATEWSGGKVINLGGLPGTMASFAQALNGRGQVVGYSGSWATEWSRGHVVNL